MILSMRLNIAIVFILAMALMLTTLLSYFQFESSLSELQNSRISVISLDIKQTVESGTNLGIELEKLRNVQNVIDRAKQNDEQILSITVFNQAGKTLFSTHSGGEEEGDDFATEVEQKWIALNLKGDLWESADDAAFVVGAPVLNSFDQVIGGTAVRYSRRIYQDMVNAVFGELRRSGLMIFLGFSLLTVIAVRFVFRRLSRAARHMDKSLNVLLQEAPGSGAGNTLVSTGDEFSDFQQRTKDALAALSDAENQAGAK
jgi:sensor histidine kinase regulating citrate/malate metabolism